MEITKKSFSRFEAENLIFQLRKEFGKNKTSSSQFFSYNHYGYHGRGWIKRKNFF